MSDALEAFEECLEGAMRDAHRFAEHNNNRVVTPGHLRAALLSQKLPEKSPSRAQSCELGLFTVRRASPSPLETICPCDECQKMSAVPVPTKTQSPPNQLATALPFL